MPETKPNDQQRDASRAALESRARSAGLRAGAIAGVLVLVCIVGTVLPIAHQYAESRFQLMREHVRALARSAAQLVDGDLHNQIRSQAQMGSKDYLRAVQPLVRFHNANPDIFYVYTMIERDGRAYFILDTATDPGLKADHSLVASDIMEPFDVAPGLDPTDWLEALQRGETYVNKDFETDAYGTFISGHAPFYDSSGAYAGFVGIDVDAGFFLRGRRSLDRATYLALGAGLVLALGLFAVVYRISGEAVRGGLRQDGRH